MRRTWIGALGALGLAFVWVGVVWGSVPAAVESVRSASPPAVRSNPVITIGVATAFQNFPFIGWRQVNAVQLAVDEANAAGGLPVGGVTYTLVLSAASSPCGTGAEALAAAHALLDAGAVAVVGPMCGPEVLAVQGLYQTAGVPLVSASAIEPEVTEGGYSTTFRVIDREDTPPMQLARYWVNQRSIRRVAIVEWGDATSETFSQTFTSLGGQITSRREVATIDAFTPTLQAIRSEGPQAIFYNGSDPQQAGLFSLIAQRLGMGSVSLGWNPAIEDRTVLATYLMQAGAAAEGDYAVMAHRAPSDMPGYAAFNAAYQAADFLEYGDEGTMAGALTYDAARLILAAIQRAGTPAPPAVRDALAGITGYQGVVGLYLGFDDRGDVIPQWGWIEQYQGGQWIPRRPMRVGLVADDELSAQGLERAARELGVVGTRYPISDPASVGIPLQQCAADGNELCFSVGWAAAGAAIEAAERYSRTLFTAIDAEWPAYPVNLRGISFASSEGAYLAGALAGMLTRRDCVGAIGGASWPESDAFVAGYQRGVECSNPLVQAVITYTASLTDPEEGARLAQSLIGLGSDVLVAPPGSAGVGAILTATQSGIWGIGVDVDYYSAVFGNGTISGSQGLLTSVMKRTDSAVFDSIRAVISATFAAGTVHYDLARDGLRLALFHEADSQVTGSPRARLERLRQDLADGRIDPLGNCPAYMTAVQWPIALEQTAWLTGSEGMVALALGPGTLTRTAVLSYTPRWLEDPGNRMTGIGLFFELSATSDDPLREALQPQQPYTLSIAYRDAEVWAAGIPDEMLLGLYYWDNGRWIKEPTGTVDRQFNRLTARPRRFATWAVLSSIPYRLWLPKVARKSR